MQNKNDDEKVFIDFLNSYNECFYRRDIEELKKFYDSENNVLIYLDNHKNNDTYNLERLKNEWKIIHVHCSFQPDK